MRRAMCDVLTCNVRCAVLALSLVLFAGALPSLARPARVGGQAAARGILDRAIATAGGEKALARATVLKWSGKAVIHAGDRRIEIEGRWIVEPPDRAIVTTWEVDKGESSARRLIVNGSEGWMERGGKRMPMAADVLAHERDQFYLYSLMRLLPLREPGVQLSVLEPRGLLVKRADRPAVEAFFDETGTLARLRTRIVDPSTKRQVLQEVTLEGTIVAFGVHWPRAIHITWDGAPYFTLQLFELALTSTDEIVKVLRL